SSPCASVGGVAGATPGAVPCCVWVSGAGGGVVVEPGAAGCVAEVSGVTGCALSVPVGPGGSETSWPESWTEPDVEGASVLPGVDVDSVAPSVDGLVVWPVAGAFCVFCPALGVDCVCSVSDDGCCSELASARV